MASKTPEGEVKKIIKKWLKEYDITYWMIIPSAYGRTTGMSDFIAILPSGKFLAIEAKAPDKKDNVSPNQTKFLLQVWRNNGIAVVISCQEDLDELYKSVVKEL